MGEQVSGSYKSQRGGRDVDEIRSVELLYREFEKVYDAEQHGTLSPKQMEQMNTTLKAMKALGVDHPRAMISMIVKAKGVGNLVQMMGEMKAPMFRTYLGLPEFAGR